MSFTELRFFIFAGVVALLYYILPQKLQWIVLLTASVVFYVSYGWERLPFLIASSLIAYFAARRMEKIYQQVSDRAEAKRKSKRILLLALVLLVGLLLYAKIGTWVMQSVAAWMKLESGAAMKAIVALGVSYYTFSLISYVADVYWRKDSAEKNYFRLLLFTIYFPKILQGPISRRKNLAPQFAQPHAFDYREFCFGLQRMLWGYFKKMVIADRVAVLVTTVFGNYQEYAGSHFLVAGLFATAQMYCDFSGCMDIAEGFSQCLGLKLESNFDRPFFSKSVPEFWRRWHSTLGTWFKDYIYMPLMISPKLIGMSKVIREELGVRGGKIFMSVVPLMTVWLLTGLWHGPSSQYFVWGIYWGVLVCCSTVFAPEIKKLTALLHINTKAASWSAFQTVRTFMAFVISRIIASSAGPAEAFSILKQMVTNFQPVHLFDKSMYNLGLDRDNFALALICIALVWGVELLQKNGSVREKLAESNLVFRWMVYYALFFVILIFGMYGPGFDAASFIYMQF